MDASQPTSKPIKEHVQPEPAAAVTQTPQASVPSQSQSKSKLPVWLTSSVIVIIGLVIFYTGVSTWLNPPIKQAVNVSNQFVSDLQADQASAAYNLTSPNVQKVNTEAYFQQTFGAIYKTLQGTSAITAKVLDKIKGQPDQAIIVYTITTSSGKQYIRNVLQQDSSWQIVAFRSASTPLTITSSD